MLSIWFFIGVLLLAYGIVILGAAIWDLMYPPAHPLILANLHAGIWWGGLLIVMGLFYSLKFKPGRINKNVQQ
jgi:hypothetical protein